MVSTIATFTIPGLRLACRPRRPSRPGRLHGPAGSAQFPLCAGVALVHDGDSVAQTEPHSVVGRSPALFGTSTGPNAYPAPSRAPRAMAPSHSRRPASSHCRICIISDSHRFAGRGLASFFGGVGEPSQSAAPAVGLFREGALVCACGGTREGGRRCADADADAECGAPRGGARGEARARADDARRRARAQVQEFARRRARLRSQPHQQAEQHPRRAVPVPVRGRRAACANLRVKHDAPAHDAVTTSASVPASPSELVHPPLPPSARRSAATILEPHGGCAAQASAARRRWAARSAATATRSRATARRAAPSPSRVFVTGRRSRRRLRHRPLRLREGAVDGRHRRPHVVPALLRASVRVAVGCTIARTRRCPHVNGLLTNAEAGAICYPASTL
jgi:hypothetical protein